MAGKKTGLLMAAGVAALSVVAGVAFVFHLFTAPMPFDSEKWKNETCCRARMERDLLSGRTLVGMEEKEVVDLLGPSDSNPKPEEYQLWYQVDRGSSEHALALKVREGRVSALKIEPVTQ